MAPKRWAEAEPDPMPIISLGDLAVFIVTVASIVAFVWVLRYFLGQAELEEARVQAQPDGDEPARPGSHGH